MQTTLPQMTVVHGSVIEPTLMDCDAHESPTERPIPDPREHDTLISRVLVAERHSSLFESEVKRLELENLLLHEKLMRLESKFEEVAYLQHHTVDYINAQLALRDDALQRQRIRDDGIFCGCCALLRLPDHFFPAMLSARVPPSRRRCVFCVQAVRANFDCFGRDFFVPPGFSMPSLTSIAATRAPPCVTSRCFSQSMTLMSRSTLPLFHPNHGFLLPSLATPLALILPAGGSPCASSVDATSCATASLPPNLHDASLSSLSLIGSLTLITRVIFPPMTVMTDCTMTSTRRSTGETYPLECL